MSLSGRREKYHLLAMISTRNWDQSENLRRTLVFVFAICFLGAVGNWYNWLHDIGSLSLPIGLTAVAVVTFLLVPRKWDLLVMSVGGVLGLEILAVVLRKGPLGPMLEAIAVTVVVAGVCGYVSLKLKRSRLSNEARDRNRTDG